MRCATSSPPPGRRPVGCRRRGDLRWIAAQDEHSITEVARHQSDRRPVWAGRRECKLAIANNPAGAGMFEALLGVLGPVVDPKSRFALEQLFSRRVQFFAEVSDLDQVRYAYRGRRIYRVLVKVLVRDSLDIKLVSAADLNGDELTFFPPTFDPYCQDAPIGDRTFSGRRQHPYLSMTCDRRNEFHPLRRKRQARADRTCGRQLHRHGSAADRSTSAAQIAYAA